MTIEIVMSEGVEKDGENQEDQNTQEMDLTFTEDEQDSKDDIAFLPKFLPPFSDAELDCIKEQASDVPIEDLMTGIVNSFQGADVNRSYPILYDNLRKLYWVREVLELKTNGISAAIESLAAIIMNLELFESVVEDDSDEFSDFQRQKFLDYLRELLDLTNEYPCLYNFFVSYARFIYVSNSYNTTRDGTSYFDMTCDE